MTIRVTLHLDAGLVQRAKSRAEKLGCSLTSLVEAQLAKSLFQDSSFHRARQRALARLRSGLDLGFVPANDRGDIYERLGLARPNVA